MGNIHSGINHDTGYSSGGGNHAIRYPNSCTVVIGSMTQTLHAQTVLAAASIRAAVTKISSNKTNHGCAYGLIYPCIQKTNVTEVLSEAGIRVRHMPGEDGL